MELLLRQLLEVQRLLLRLALFREARVRADLPDEFVMSVEARQLVLVGAPERATPHGLVIALILQFLHGGLEVLADLVLILAQLILFDLRLTLHLSGEVSLGSGRTIALRVETALAIVLLFLNLFELLVSCLAAGGALLVAGLVLLLALWWLLLGG